MRPKAQKYLSLGLATLASMVLVFIVMVSCTDKQAKAKPNFVNKPAPKPGLLAKIGGEEITEEGLIGDDKLDFFDLKKREFELKMDRLNKLVIEKLIGAEAKKANMSLDDYIAKKVVGGDIKISDKDYNKFVAEKNIPQSQINPQIKERIMAYLQGQKKQEMIDGYVAKLTKANPVEVYFSKPKMNIAVEPGNGPSEGGKDAKVTIVEFSDFQCPFCSRAATTMHEVKKKYGNKIRVVFRQFPLPMHKDALPASEMAMCVNEQGSDKFWKFYDFAFKNQDKLDVENLKKYAKDSGADAKKAEECFNAKKFAAAVRGDMEYGEKLGVKSTPTFFINGQLVAGALPIEQFSEIIDEELGAK
jgi:protein-disulfide isomerase